MNNKDNFMDTKQLREEELAEKLHEWYLEACQDPESGTDYNPEAQVLYKNLRESQKFLDRYIARKIISLLSEREKEVRKATALEIAEDIQGQVDVMQKQFSVFRQGIKFGEQLIKSIKEASTLIK